MEINDAATRTVPIFGKRHVVALWLFASYLIIFSLRVSINVAIVSMVNHTQNAHVAALRNDTCPFPENVMIINNNITTRRRQAIEGEFDWDKHTQGIILSSFYYGYICTQIIGGIITRILGPRIVIGAGIGATAALSLLNPIAARISPAFLVALRVAAGVFAGLTYPCGHMIISSWAPKQERSVLAALPVTGGNLGTVLAAPITGLLCEYGFDGGWPSSFYFFGAISLLWCCGWFYFVRDTPRQHPSISLEERRYIEENSQSAVKPVPFTKVPWKSILLSGSVWAINIAQMCYAFNFYTILIGASTYLRDVLHISATLNGIITSLPYICLWFTQIFASFMSGLLVAKGMTISHVRKLVFGIGMMSSSAILVVISYAGCNAFIAIILICISVALGGISFAGFIVNHVDIAPQYASILMGIANTFATLSGILTPLIKGAIIHEESSIATWQIVFYISAAVSIAGALIFALLGDGQVQPWAVVDDGESNTRKEDLETTVKLLAATTNNSGVGKSDSASTIKVITTKV